MQRPVIAGIISVIVISLLVATKLDVHSDLYLWRPTGGLPPSLSSIVQNGNEKKQQVERSSSRDEDIKQRNVTQIPEGIITASTKTAKETTTAKASSPPKKQKKPSIHTPQLNSNDKDSAHTSQSESESSQEKTKSSKHDAETSVTTQQKITESDTKRRKRGGLLNYGSMTISDYYGSTPSNPPLNGEALCELNLLHLENCYFEENETSSQCIARIGARRLSHALSTRCKRTKFFRSLLADEEKKGKKNSDSDDLYPLKRGLVFQSQTYQKEDREAKRSKDETDDVEYIAPYAPPRVCANKCLQYPISFSTPSSMIVDKVTRMKLLDWSPMIPAPMGKPQPYAVGYNDEWFSQTILRHSYFAFTHKRGGWDCMRHYEILAAGAIPYFADLVHCPVKTLSHLPKPLLFEAMKLGGLEYVPSDFVIEAPPNVAYYSFKGPASISKRTFNRTGYFLLADKLLDFTKKYLTTKATVRYILKVVQLPRPKHVLMIGIGMYDYMHQMIENGLSELRIRTTVVGGCPNGMFQMKKVFKGANKNQSSRSFSAAAKRDKDILVTALAHSISTQELEDQRTSNRLDGLAGNGFLFGMRTNPDIVTHEMVGTKDPGMQSRIESKAEFDLVIYTVMADRIQQLPYWSSVEKAFDISRRVFINGKDDVSDPDVVSMELCKVGVLFKREMHDAPC